MDEGESDYLLVTSRWQKKSFKFNMITLITLITCIFQLPRRRYYSSLISSSFIPKIEIRGNQVIILFLNDFSGNIEVIIDKELSRRGGWPSSRVGGYYFRRRHLNDFRSEVSRALTSPSLLARVRTTFAFFTKVMRSDWS